jgi:hypothetical protein
LRTALQVSTKPVGSINFVLVLQIAVLLSESRGTLQSKDMVTLKTGDRGLTAIHIGSAHAFSKLSVLNLLELYSCSRG